eukprot:SAG31_NODE_3840_length_3824_cov_3.657817_1_plen_206_part_00
MPRKFYRRLAVACCTSRTNAAKAGRIRCQQKAVRVVATMHSSSARGGSVQNPDRQLSAASEARITAADTVSSRIQIGVLGPAASDVQLGHRTWLNLTASIPVFTQYHSEIYFVVLREPLTQSFSRTCLAPHRFTLQVLVGPTETVRQVKQKVALNVSVAQLLRTRRRTSEGMRMLRAGGDELEDDQVCCFLWPRNQNLMSNVSSF